MSLGSWTRGRHVAVAVLLIGVGLAVLNPAASRLVTAMVAAPSLGANTVGVADRQPVLVYLPPGYNGTERRYPVLYFLPGYDDPPWTFTSGDLQDFRLRDAMDRLLAKDRIEELIVVLPGSLTPLGGTFYANSPVLGNWADYITRDLVAYVDARFRTAANPAGRAIAGTTVGGTGALDLAMRHPGVFGAVYALDPVLLRPGALEESGFYDPATASRLLALQETLDRLPEPRIRPARALRFQALLGSDTLADRMLAFWLVMGTAFTPDPSRPGLPVRLPFRRTPAGPVVDPRLRSAFEAGLGDWPAKIARYDHNLRRLRLLVIDYGVDTEIHLLPAGCEHLAGLLRAAGIPHRCRPHAGDAESRFRQRMEDFLLPTVSDVVHAER